MKALLPTSTALSPSLPSGVVAVPYDVGADIPADQHDAEVAVVWGNPSWQLDHMAGHLTGLQLVQSLAAGPDTVLDAGFGPRAAICSGVGLHDLTVAEHALALTLTLLRRLPTAARAQAERRWDTSIGGLQPLRPEGAVTSFVGARVLIWGFGGIARTLAPLLRALGADVRGVARSAGRRDGFDVITERDLDTALPTTDVLVMILPASAETQSALSAQRLSALPAHAYVVNVGRGTTVDEAALVEALESRSIAGAALDVTAVEPLPSDSSLWGAPNLVLTPHAAGGRPVGADALIEHNVRALLSGGALRNLVRPGVSTPPAR